jgi:hypothetical protein
MEEFSLIHRMIALGILTSSFWIYAGIGLIKKATL